MENLREEVEVLKNESNELDKQIEKERKELEELKKQAFEMNIRRIVLEEMLGYY